MERAVKYKKMLQRINWNVLGHRDYLRFAIVGNARTGSNYLLAGLNSSKHIKMHDEIFALHKRETGKDYDLIFSTLFRKEKKCIKAVGFKLFYYHLTTDEWNKFMLNRDFMIIHITRRNRLRTIVSLDIAHKTDQWSSSAGRTIEPMEKRIFIDTSKLIGRLEQIQNREAMTRNRLKDWQMLEVVYEDLVHNPLEVFQRAGAFLGTDGIDIQKIELTKQNPEKLETLIINYEEVYRWLKGTRFAEYLSD